MVPPARKRLCKLHGLPITPSQWLRGYRTVNCSRCSYESCLRSRRKRWESGNIPFCKNHPEAHVPIVWISDGKRLCYPCRYKRFRSYYPHLYEKLRIRARNRYREIMADPKKHKQELLRMKAWRKRTNYRGING